MSQRLSEAQKDVEYATARADVAEVLAHIRPNLRYKFLSFLT